ncbi:MAG TPA: T9SS type A sorting domain-containing protein [Bacteroidales bacterium]|nr:T9SS type A sorting domain-containing protein [Bacteroidales bacterium]
MKKSTTLLVVLMICLIGTSFAQWTNNPLENTAIAKKSSEQALPKIVVHVDGTAYISWFTMETGVYNVRMQRIDNNGNPQWGDNGILVSSEPQDSWITDYDLAIDPDGYALIVFMDLRTGESNPVAYRVSPTGEMVWGTSGILLANNSNFDPNPKVCATSTGNAVFSWQSAGDNLSEVRLQKISAAGEKLWGEEGIILSDPSLSLTSPSILPAGADQVFLVWHEESGPFWSPNRGLYVQKLDADGNFIFASETVIYSPVPAGPVVYLEMCRDDEGGIVFTWYRNDEGLHFHSYIQHMNVAGDVTMQANGVMLSATSGRNHMYPEPVFLAQNQEIITFFSEQDLNQNERGFYAQKLDMEGNRLWGEEGKELIPLGNSDYGQFTADGYFDRAICIYQEAIYGTNTAKMQAVMLDKDGDFVWSSAFIDMSTAQSEKLHNVSTSYYWGQWVAVWEDRRDDDGDIFAQNIQPDGTLGIVTTGIQQSVNDDRPFSILPNPFHESFTIDVSGNNTIFRFYDPKGTLIISSVISPGSKTFNTSLLPSGIYFYQIIQHTGVSFSGKMIK